MTTPIRVGIAGYGNLGRGVETAISKNEDMTLVGVFSRREPSTVQTLNPSTAVFSIDALAEFKDKIDVLILCGGSKDDLPVQGPEYAAMFNTVDSFDTHARIPEYFESVDAPAKANNKTALISIGWDPGMFSINRLMGEALLPDGETYTFWGKGLSQGHSDAVRRVEGVKAGVQYTLPSEKAMERVRAGENPELTTGEKHKRECFVVAEEGADHGKIAEAIKTMPNYFEDYETTVHFITEEELERDHKAMPHGGFVIHSGKTGNGTDQLVEFSLKLDSNPEFTASVLIAYARAAYRLYKKGATGAKTVYDIAPGYLHPESAEELRRKYL